MANGLSLLMPYAEPLFIKAVRSGLDDLDPATRPGWRTTSARRSATTASTPGSTRSSAPATPVWPGSSGG